MGYRPKISTHVLIYLEECLRLTYIRYGCRLSRSASQTTSSSLWPVSGQLCGVSDGTLGGVTMMPGGGAADPGAGAVPASVSALALPASKTAQSARAAA